MVRSAAKPRVSNHEAMDARSGFDRTGNILDADRERWGYRGRLCLARNHLADDVVWVMVAVTPALQRRRHFFEADRLAAILVQLAENVVGLREVGAAGAERASKFRFADLAGTVSIELREQVLQRVRLAGQGRPR